MPMQIPGRTQSTISPIAQDELGVFVAEMADSQSIVFRGQRIEAFYTGESDNYASAGDRVQCMFVPQMQSVFVLGKIA